VINFITKKDYQGGTVTVGADNPQHDGGFANNFNVGYGWGDLEKNGFNIFAMVDHQSTAPHRRHPARLQHPLRRRPVGVDLPGQLGAGRPRRQPCRSRLHHRQPPDPGKTASAR
jgi:hypothetical protein